jgi:hypothetical protein
MKETLFFQILQRTELLNATWRFYATTKSRQSITESSRGEVFAARRGEERLAHHAGAAALHEFFDFLARGHGGVAGRCRS